MMMAERASLAALLLLFLCTIPFSTADLEVLYPVSLRKTYGTVARLDILPTEYDVMGQLVLAEPNHCCGEITNSNLNGTVLLCMDTPRCTVQEKGRTVSRVEGVQGMVLVMTEGSVGSNFYYGEKRDDSTHLATLEIANLKGMELVRPLEDGEYIYVRMTTPDSNPWRDIAWGPAGGLFQLIGELASIACFCFACWKWREFIIARGIQLEVPQVCLVLQIITGLVRMLYFIQPLRFSKHFYPDGFASFLETITQPITWTTTFLITFYWQTALQEFKRSKRGRGAAVPDLGKYRIPFIIIIAIIWTIEIVTNIMRSAAKSVVNDLIFISVGLTIVIALFCMIFFTVTGIRILRAMKRSQARVDRGRGKTLKSITTYVVISAIGIFLFFLVGILFVSPVNTTGPTEAFLVWVLLWTSLFLISGSQIAAFRAKEGKASSSSNGTDPNLKTASS